jgi:hypothetical protein
MHSILARARANVDLSELPSKDDIYNQRQVASRPQPEITNRDFTSHIKQAEIRSKHQFQLQLATDSQPAEPAKLMKSKMPKDRAMSMKEENVALNTELEGMGRQVKKMSWATPEIENLWLRREATSQLLMKLCTTSKGVSTSLLDLDDTSTRAPSSAGGSVRRFSSRA